MRAQIDTGLAFNPFRDRGESGVFVATPTHRRALEGLRGAIVRGERRVWLTGEAGVGKSCVVEQMAEELRGSDVRVVRGAWCGDAGELYSNLALQLAGPAGTANLAALRQAVRICRLEGLGVVIVVDADELTVDWPVVGILARLDPDPRARLSVVAVERRGGLVADGNEAEWECVVRVEPLTRMEAAAYLEDKAAALNGTTIGFTAEAATLIHALARGIPRGLDRLADRALAEAIRRGASPIDERLVEYVATGHVAGAA